MPFEESVVTQKEWAQVTDAQPLRLPAGEHAPLGEPAGDSFTINPVTSPRIDGMLAAERRDGPGIDQPATNEQVPEFSDGRGGHGADLRRRW